MIYEYWNVKPIGLVWVVLSFIDGLLREHLFLNWKNYMEIWNIMYV